MGHRLLRTAVAATLVLSASAASWPAPSPARAQAEPAQPPVPTFPPAGDIAPPDWAIWNIWDQEGMFGPSLDCSAWYPASDYAGRWATDSTWWEYRCGALWGASGPYIDYFDYYHWDGVSAVYYGTWGTESTADATLWGHNPECSYWYDVAAPGSTWTDHWFRPIACTTGIPAPPQLVRYPAEPPLEWGGGYTIKGEIAATLHCVLTRSREGTPIYDRPCGGHGFWAVMGHGVGYASLADGTYTLSVTQTDLAGNTSAPATDTFTVDRLPGPAPPTFLTTPDEVSSDSTPTWIFGGEPGATFHCTLSQPFEGQWDGGSDGTQPEPAPVVVDSGACDSGSYTFDLGAFPDRGYSLSVTQTDVGGITSEPVTDSFRLDRAVPNAGPTARVTASCVALNCTFDGAGSSDGDGAVVAYGWDFADGTTANGGAVDHAYGQPGTFTVTLTVTDDDGAVDTATETVAVAAPNAPPTAAFTVSCTGPDCAFDGQGSSDGDGTIAGFGWAFGDGTTANGATVDHSYAQPDSYAVRLTVTDDDGATATTTKLVAPVTLTAHGYRVNARQKVDLAWTGSSTGGFDIYRNGVRVVTVHSTAYTDNINKRGGGTYVYTVRAVATSIRSNQVTVTF